MPIAPGPYQLGQNNPSVSANGRTRQAVRSASSLDPSPNFFQGFQGLGIKLIDDAGNRRAFHINPSQVVHAEPLNPQGQVVNQNLMYITGGPLVFTNLASGNVMQYNGTQWINTTPAGLGTVTSVGLSMPPQFAVSGSPITTSGTLSAAWNNQTANTVLAGPTSGGATAPSFRALVAADFPSGIVLGTANQIVSTYSAGTYTESLANPTVFPGGATFNGDVQFSKFKALALVIDQGATLPASPVKGQWFLHTPTGRNNLCQYDGTQWQFLEAFGATTIYVDSVNGTDSQNNGGASGASAFRTLQFAWNQLPALLSGNVTINLSNSTFTEQVTLRGKSLTGSYTITIAGTRAAALDSLTNGAGAVQGTGATQGTVVRNAGTWTANQRQNKMVRFTSGVNSGTTFLIDSNTSTTLTIVGTWPNGAPGNGDTFVVEDWGTTLNGTTLNACIVTGGQQALTLNDIYFKNNAASGYYPLNIANGAVVTQNTCRMTGGMALNPGGNCSPTSCLYDIPGSWALTSIIEVYFLSIITASYVKIDATNGAVGAITLLDVENVSNAFMSDGCVFEGSGSGNGQTGFYLNQAEGNCFNSVSNVRIRNCATGILATLFSAVVATDSTQIVYSGNTSNIVWDYSMPQSAVPSLTEGIFWNDSTQKCEIAYVDGIQQYRGGSLFTATATAGPSNSAAETSLIGSGIGTHTLPTNFFVAGKSIRVKVSGYYGTKAVAPGNITIRVKLGSTVIGTTGAAALTGNLSNLFFEVDYLITCRTPGGAGTVFGQGIANMDIAILSENAVGMVKTATTTVDTTATQVVDCTAQFDTADVANLIQGTNVTIEVLS